MRKYVTLQQAAALLPVKVSTCTLWRWCAKGVYVRTVNEIVRLQHVYVGRRMLTTELWLEEFIDRLTAARMTERQWRAGARPGRKWQRYAELCEADIVLRRAGISPARPD